MLVSGKYLHILVINFFYENVNVQVFFFFSRMMKCLILCLFLATIFNIANSGVVLSRSKTCTEWDYDGASDGCCPRIDSYFQGEKVQGSFIIQSEMVNGYCHYVEERNYASKGLWMCGDNWWYGFLSDKGQCKGFIHASTDSKPNVHVQDDSLQWKWVYVIYDGSDADLKFICVI